MVTLTLLLKTDLHIIPSQGFGWDFFMQLLEFLKQHIHECFSNFKQKQSL